MTASADEFHRLKLMVEGATAVHLCCKDLEHVAEALRIAERVMRDEFVDDAVYFALDEGIDVASFVLHQLTDPNPA